MELKKVCIKELDDFIRSDWFQTLPDKPISSFRVNSYLKNPHALPDDPVLYFLKEDDRIWAYRTVFADRLTNDGKRFAWFSGNWVHPDYRRKGLSEQLLKEIIIDWKKRLVFTNYAPASLQLYQKTKQFYPFYEATGRRFYLFAKTQKLFYKRYPEFSLIWKLVDRFICLFASVKVLFFRRKDNKKFVFEKMDWPDDECYELIEMQKQKYLFSRGKDELQWILANPWVSTSDKKFVESYAFSSFSNQFEYRTVKVFQKGKFIGFMMYSIRDGHLKLLFKLFNIDCNPLLSSLARYLVREAVDEKLEMMTVLDSELTRAIQRQTTPFLFSKGIDHHFYSSFAIDNKHLKIQDGDGDYIFS